MFSTKWQTSPRRYGITMDRDIAIPVRSGVTLDSDIFRPNDEGKFPALLAVHAYSKAAQSMPMMPEGFSYARGFIETGDFNFYVRRGYALVIVNITELTNPAEFSAISILNPFKMSVRQSNGRPVSPGATAT